jgi:hypothetical protein
VAVSGINGSTILGKENGEMIEPQPEDAKWVHGLNREDAHRAHDNSEEFHSYSNKAAIDTANLSLRTLVIINGGAAIAVLTFLGGVASKDKIDFVKVGVVADTLRWFALGVALAVFAMALSYFTHFAMASITSSQNRAWVHPYVSDGLKTARWRRINLAFHILAMLVAFGSLVLFLVGMFTASDAVTHLLNK